MKSKWIMMAGMLFLAASSTQSFALTCKPQLTVAGSGFNGVAAEADAYLNWRTAAENAYGTPYKNWVLAQNKGRSTKKIKIGKWTAEAHGDPCKI